VRVLGEVTDERIRILRQADEIVVSEMKAADWYYKVWQSLLFFYRCNQLALWATNEPMKIRLLSELWRVRTAMTADCVRIPFEILARISSRISNEVKGVNRVCYDISSKPRRGTIEWE